MVTSNRIAFMASLCAISGAYAHKPAFHNLSKQNITVKMQLAGADQKSATLQPGQSIDFQIGGWCISEIVIEVVSGTLKGLVVNDYLPQKDAFPFFGTRCGSFNVYIKDGFNPQGKPALIINDLPQEGGYMIERGL